MTAEVQKALESLDRLAQAEQDAPPSATQCRNGMICLVHALQREVNKTGLTSGSISSISQRVVQLMQQHLEDSEVQRWGAATLEELFRRTPGPGRADQDTAAWAMTFRDAISALVSGAQASPAAIDLQRRCFSALICLLTTDDEDDAFDGSILASHMLEHEVMSLVAGAMQLHALSPSLLECAVSLISSLVLEGGDVAADEAFRTGCLKATLSTLARTLDNSENDDQWQGSCLVADASLQQTCLRALWSVSESGELGVTEIAADTGLESVISILSQDGTAEVHKWCASVLQSMLAKGGSDGLLAESVMLLNGSEVLVASIARYVDHLDVIERCAAALATLAAYGPDAAVSVLEAGGLRGNVATESHTYCIV